MRALLFLPIVTATAAAQQVQARTLTKPEAEYSEPFSGLTSVFELKDGRVVAADARDKSLQAVDLRAGTSTKIGREGAGPQEWNVIFGLFGWKGDSVLANDVGNGRYLVVAPDAKPVRTFSTVADGGPVIVEGPGGGRRGDAGRGDGGRGGRADGGRSDGGGRAVTVGPGGRGGLRLGGGFSSARGTDSRGRLYAQDFALAFDDKGNIVPGDSAPITRLDVATNKTDTIAFVNLAKSAASGSARGDGRGGESVQIRVGGSDPYAGADEWTVFRDGTVAIVRVKDYHVEYILPNGKRVVGRPVAFTPVRVGEAEKKEWRDRQKNGTRITRTVGDGGGGGAAAAAALSAPPPEPATWPATKPPFENGAAFAAPNGDVWVRRSRAASDKIPTVDVFNAQAQHIGTVKFPENTRLVGLGPKGVYTVRVDDDDLQYLQLHAMQWTGCTPELKESCGR